MLWSEDDLLLIMVEVKVVGRDACSKIATPEKLIMFGGSDDDFNTAATI